MRGHHAFQLALSSTEQALKLNIPYSLGRSTTVEIVSVSNLPTVVPERPFVENIMTAIIVWNLYL